MPSKPGYTFRLLHWNFMFAAHLRNKKHRIAGLVRIRFADGHYVDRPIGAGGNTPAEARRHYREMVAATAARELAFKALPTTKKERVALMEKCAAVGYSTVAKNLRYDKGKLADFLFDHRDEYSVIEMRVWSKSVRQSRARLKKP